MTEAVRIEQLPASRSHPFARACREGRAFLPPVPANDDDWRRAAAEASAAAKALPFDLAARLADRQAAMSSDVRAQEGARALGEAGTLLVVTGQQPGLFGGPMLALHKAAGAIRLARRLDALLDARVVPVFWLATDDHDVDEANRCWLLDREGRPRRLAVEGLEADGRSLADISVSSAATDALLAGARDVLPDTERARELLGLLARRSDEGFATWCGRCLVALLGETGLVLLEPELLAPHAGEALALLLERASDVRRALRSAGEALAEAGWTPPLAPAEGEAPVFLRTEPGGPRLRVAVDATGRVRLRGEDAGMEMSEVAARVRADPRLASGDAAGRVIVQDALLPVLAYVGGPTELAYHAQVRRAHEALGLRYPIAVPRPEATWVDDKAARIAEGFGVSVGEVVADPDALARAAEAREGDRSLDLALDVWQQAVARTPSAVQAALEEGGEGRRRLESATRRLAREVAKEADRVRAAAARDRGVGADRRRRLEDLVRPRGRPQERSLSAVSIAARHGLEALRDGLARLDPEVPGHYVIHLA